MEFEWDVDKNRQNISKHGVSFEDAIKIFEGFTFDVSDDRFNYDEERTISIGIAGNIAVLVVVHTDRDGNCRIISARQATTRERKRYEKALRQTFNS